MQKDAGARLQTPSWQGQGLAFPMPPLSRRSLLQWGGYGALLAGAAVLAGCGSAPKATASRVRRAPAGPQPRMSRAMPEVAVRHPVQISPALREEAVARALLAVNAPYRYGGSSLEAGFDCSGLVHYVFSGFAMQALPRSAAQWAQASMPLDSSQLQRGDLVFFNTSGAAFSHMGIYVGGREFVHAPSSGKVVSTDSLDRAYYAARFDGARTVFVG